MTKAYELEDKEWSQFWWESASDRECARILLVGDSIARGYRDALQELLGAAMCVDLYATSKAVDNPSYRAEIALALGQNGLEYTAVLWNNGLHGWHLPTGAYAALAEECLAWLQAEVPAARLMVSLSTPCWHPGGGGRIDAEKDCLIGERNAALHEIARWRGLLVNDLYALMRMHPECCSEDGVHFLPKGQRLLAGQSRSFLIEG